MPRILLIGNTGQLGWELERSLMSRGDVTSLDYPAINLAEERNIRKIIHEAGSFQAIINAAAYTAVDRAESEPSLAMSINAYGPAVLAEVASNMRAVFIHYSTDYVFDGRKSSPYIETNEPNPLGVYGASKLAGERAIAEVGGSYLILRTAWVYSLRRDSFVTKVLKWAKEQPSLRIVSDQISNPTWSRTLAEATVRLLIGSKEVDLGWIKEKSGLYHLSGTGYTSRFEWAKEIICLAKKKESFLVHEIVPADTADFDAQARRPPFSALNCHKFEKTFGFRLPPWKDSLSLALQSG